jgi:EmrB/QacA subfamily drug resistance transporter
MAGRGYRGPSPGPSHEVRATAVSVGPIEADAAADTDRSIVVVFAALCTGTLLAALDQTIVSTALPTIVGELGGLDQLSWVVTVYLLTSTAVTPLYGRVSDVYGRKRVYQAAIGIFLVGSLLCGVAQDLPQLILFRGIQGLGGGGLMAMAFAIIGDVVSPRDRGRYTGILGSVFAVASIAGPLLGGFLVDHASWRWAFTINLPFGLVAVFVTQRYLHLPRRTSSARIDVVGALLLVAGVSCVLLGLVWGGDEHPWTSPTIVGLFVAGAALLAAFVTWEGRVEEPILPLRLFRDRVVAIASVLLFLLGAAIFGAIVFLPVYLQVSTGASATTSGLLTLPLMVGVTTTSIISGRWTARTGRYRSWPIAGTGVGTVGMLLLSRVEADSSRAFTSLGMVVLGAGMGMVMQTLILAAQNAVSVRDIGVVSSSVTFFRSMGGTFGVAVLGAVFAARLGVELPAHVPQQALAGTDLEVLLNSPDAIRALSPAVRDGVLHAVAASVRVVFLCAVPALFAGWVLAWLLPERPLRETLVDQPVEPLV